MMPSLAALTLGLLLFPSFIALAQAASITEDEAHAIGVDADGVEHIVAPTLCLHHRPHQDSRSRACFGPIAVVHWPDCNANNPRFRAGILATGMVERATGFSTSGRKPLVALTGATGFIGQFLLQELPKRGYRIRVLLRRPSLLPTGCASAVIGDLSRPHNMAEALAEVDAVIHSAGLAPSMSGCPDDDYRLFNSEATIAFARAAQRAKVKRFVFLSSLRAQAGPTADCVLTEDREPTPTDAYGRSKLEAERGLAETDLDWVALRLALVYGPGVQGNMARLMQLARSPYPLPLAGLKTEHSLLALDNLVEAVDKVLATTEPLRRPLIVADPKPLTIGAMIAAMREGLGRKPSLFYVPRSVLAAALRARGGMEAYQPLFGSLVADCSALGRLNWVPPVSTPTGLSALLRQNIQSELARAN